MKSVKKIGLAAMLFSSVVSTTLPTIGELSIVNAEEIQQTEQQATYRNVMYYGDWSIWGGEGNFYPKDIPADQLTHLNFAFLDFDSDGELVFTDADAATGAPVGLPGVQWNSASSGILNAIQDLRGKNPNMKIGVSLGGWSKSGDFSEVAANPTKRKNLVDNVAKFIKYTNMDFVDVDWEFPADVRQPDLVDNVNDEGTPNAKPEDKENYIKLLDEIRETIDKQGEELGKTYELSVALPAAQGKLDSGIDVKRLFDVVDFANIMTYDLTGAWSDTSGHHSALYGNPADPNYDEGFSVDQTVEYLREKGAASEKIVIGAAFYTRGWNEVAKGDNEEAPGLFQKAELSSQDADQTPSYGAKNKNPLKVGDGGRASGVWPYRDIETLLGDTSGLKEYWDDVAKAPFMYSETTGEFFTYENEKSVTYKAEYVKENQLGGIISWQQSQDKETTGTKRDELTNAIKEGLLGSEKLPEFEIKSTPLNVDVEISTYTQYGVSGYDVKITNNEKMEETSSVLKLVEFSQETIKLPKLVIPMATNEKLGAGDYKAGTVTNVDGAAIVDLSSVYDGKEIAPGASYEFRLSSNAAEADVAVDNIDSITLSQRIGDEGIEINKQVIFGEGSTTEPGTPDTEAPSVPTGLTASTIGETNVSLSWTKSTDDKGVAGYYVFRDGKQVGQSATTSFTDAGLTADTEYSYTVKAFDRAGNVSEESKALVVKTLEKAPVDTEAPSIPLDLKASTIGEKNVSLSWTRSTDNVAVAGYYVFRDGKQVGQSATTSFADAGLTPNTEYSYTVKAFDAAGNVSEESKALVVTTLEETTPPAEGEWDANKVYDLGDVVTHKGNTYRAKWWTQGDEPGTEQWGPWELIG